MVRRNEDGFVSLFSVIFFMLFITVITVGFLRIMGIEQQQSLSNDLSASALASAESGIEDGKRAILKYMSLPDGDPVKNALTNAFNSNSCNALTSSPAIQSALGVDPNGNVIGNSQLNQYYTCLTVNLNTPDYESSSTAGQSVFLPLRTADPNGFEQIKISWHLISQNVGSDGDGTPQNYAPGPLLDPVINVNGNTSNAWSYWGYPAYLRVQMYGNPTGNFTRANTDSLSHSVLLIPASTGNTGTPIDLGANDPRGFNQTKTPLQQIQCLPNPGSNIGAYACTATLQLPAGVSSNANNLYLRVTPEYGQTHFTVQLLHNGTPVNMNQVQPVIDATGRADDVYRRVQARVTINPVSNLPEYTVESANSICKDMQVSDGSYFKPNSCP